MSMHVEFRRIFAGLCSKTRNNWSPRQVWMEISMTNHTHTQKKLMLAVTGHKRSKELSDEDRRRAEPIGPGEDQPSRRAKVTQFPSLTD